MALYRTLDDVDWANWEPTERATLLFVIRDARVLLIRKKRGLGAGKINGPGGRIDAGETPKQAAVREVREELRITPTAVRQHGELFFQFVDGFSIHGYVFRADDWEGEPEETEEAIPLWTPLDRIPYAEMWADDRIWFPWLLERRHFRGWMLFEDDDLLEHRFELEPAGTTRTTVTCDE